MDWNKVSTELSKKLEPKAVVKPSGQFGPKGDYIEGWHAIAEANRIFGFDGWSYTAQLNKVSEFTNEKGNIEIGYICTCSVIVDNVTRQDVGYGSGAAKKPGDAHESAVKEAVTDALKRCLRTFGNPFGLALYDKSRASVGENLPDASETEIFTTVDRIENLLDMDALKAYWSGLNRDMKHVASDAAVIAAKDKRRGELS